MGGGEVDGSVVSGGRARWGGWGREGGGGGAGDDDDLGVAGTTLEEGRERVEVSVLDGVGRRGDADARPTPRRARMRGPGGALSRGPAPSRLWADGRPRCVPVRLVCGAALSLSCLPRVWRLTARRDGSGGAAGGLWGAGREADQVRGGPRGGDCAGARGLSGMRRAVRRVPLLRADPDAASRPDGVTIVTTPDQCRAGSMNAPDHCRAGYLRS